MVATDARIQRPTQTVQRALSLLDVLGDADAPLSLTEIAERSRLHISTCLRLLRTLERAAYLERHEESGHYRLGSKIFTLAHALERQLDIRTVARPILQRLSDATGEGASLVVRQGTEAMVLERAISRSQLGFLAGVGARGPLYCTASGKALLAYAEPEFVDYVLTHQLPELTANTIITAEGQRDEIARTRTRGYAVDDGEREDGLFGLAAPVRDVSSRVVAVLSVTGPAERIKTQTLPRTVALLLRAAADISAQLGWTDKARAHEEKEPEVALADPPLSSANGRSPQE